MSFGVHAGLRTLDRLVFGTGLQPLRAELMRRIRSRAMVTKGLFLLEGHEEIARASMEDLVRLTELALRRLNNPAALAQCGLMARIPAVLAAAGGSELSPLEAASALRGVLACGIARLRPPEGGGIGAPGALQYHILHEEYLVGLLNKQIMARHSISEGTFHRNRRQAIVSLARELDDQEKRLSMASKRAKLVRFRENVLPEGRWAIHAGSSNRRGH